MTDFWELLARFVCIFAIAKNKCSPPSSRRRRRSSAPHLIFQIWLLQENEAHPNGWASLKEVLSCCDARRLSSVTAHLRPSPTAATRSPPLTPPPAAVGSLPRFELATSSLPTILKRFLPCASYRKLLDKTLVYQGLLGFAYRCLS